MRVLFLGPGSNLYKEAKNSYNGGGWISSLINQLKSKTDLEIAFASFSKKDNKEEIDQLICYEIRIPQISKFDNFLSFIFNDHISRERRRWPVIIEKINEVVLDFHPDIIQVFGSETEYGLIAQKTQIPVILHIQGILNPYLNAFLPPSFSWQNLYKWSLFKYYSCKINQFQWESKCYREKEILKSVHNYFGRTEWDKRITKIYNPNSNYFYCSEILRPEFYRNKTRICPTKLKICSTISGPFYKGYDLILKTANILKNDLLLDFEWIVFGNVRAKVIEDHYGLSHENLNITLKGVVTPNVIEETILISTLFFHPSYIDNSPNSICEAQMLGCPVIAVNAGGVPSIVTEGLNGLLIPANDPYQAGYLISMISKDSEKLLSMSENARKTALERHSIGGIIADIKRTYKQLTICQ